MTSGKFVLEDGLEFRTLSDEVNLWAEQVLNL